MPLWFDCFTVAVAVGNVALGAYNLHRLRHLLLLDRLLALICVKSYQIHQTPVWKAWTDTMGDISVEVTSRRRSWDAIKGPR
jgi:hypothetical protein